MNCRYKEYGMTDLQKKRLLKKFESVCTELKNTGADLSKIKIVCEVSETSIKQGLIDRKRLKEHGYI